VGAELKGASRYWRRALPIPRRRVRWLAPLRPLETPSVPRPVAAAAQAVRWAAGDVHSREPAEHLAAGAGLSAVRAASQWPTAERPRLGAGAAACPSRAWLAREIAPRDRPGSPRERPRFRGHRSSAMAASGAAAALAEAHSSRVEDPTSRSRQSTDGWLLGRVVAAPRHSFDEDPSIARRGAASTAHGSGECCAQRAAAAFTSGNTSEFSSGPRKMASAFGGIRRGT
jgi:hypothetical protein